MKRRVRQARHYQSPDAPIRRLADGAIPALARAFRQTLAVGRRMFDEDKARYMIANGGWATVPRLIDWGHADEAMRRPLGAVGDIWLAAGEIGERRLNGAFTSRRRVVRFKRENLAPAIDWHGHEAENYLAKVAVEKDQADLFNYDRFDPVTQAHIRAYQDELIQSLGEESRAVIERTVMLAMRDGRFTADDIIAQIRAVIGLTPRQAQAVLNYRAALLEMDSGVMARGLMPMGDKIAFEQARAAGRLLDMGQITDMVERYESAYLDSRALSIATTEATRAASLGLQDSYAQAVARGVMPPEAIRQYWQVSLDERTCPLCLGVVDRNPEGVPIGEPFDSEDGPIDGPPYHPNCRCSIEIVTNLDLVPDDAFD